MISFHSGRSGSNNTTTTATSSGGGSGVKHLRSKLRSVMSDRVMRITKECSKQQQQQQQNAKIENDKQNVKFQRLLSGNSSNASSFSLPSASDDKKNSLAVAAKTPTANSNYFNYLQIRFNASFLINFFILDLTDKKSLVEYCRNIYNDVVEKEAPIVKSAKYIVDAIIEFSKLNSLDPVVKK